MKLTFFIAIIFTLFSSCKKSQLFTNATLVGKWKLTEVFYGYFNGVQLKGVYEEGGFKKRQPVTGTGFCSKIELLPTAS